MSPPHCQSIIDLFNTCFEHREHTVLIGGADEPLYQPSQNTNEPHKIYFTLNYTSSALHEIAHWTLAGPTRRMQVDYGYWYEPDGRTQAQQTLFEQVEIKPQAIEKLFSQACGQPFNISADNLEANIKSSDRFEQAVTQQAEQYTHHENLPPRAEYFLKALKQAFSTSHPNTNKTHR